MQASHFLCNNPNVCEFPQRQQAQVNDNILSPSPQRLPKRKNILKRNELLQPQVTEVMLSIPQVHNQYSPELLVPLRLGPKSQTCDQY